ncbi:MAG: phosphoglucomutase/phosphomannomutase family protein, partial [Dehalococcoidales bacterium]
MSNLEHSVIKFGTDGWRGIIAEDFTFDNVRLCALATAKYILKSSNDVRPLVVVGYDTRFASEAFARAVAGVMTENGIRVVISASTCATPALSYAVAARQASAGIMITASHNPAEWNGFKIKATNGSSASPETISTIEEIIADLSPGPKSNSTGFDKAVNSGLADITDINSYYLARLASMVDIKAIQKTPLKIAFDGMFGSGTGYLSELLKGGQLGVIEINAGPNPAFPG